jgi:hypothetical protein
LYSIRNRDAVANLPAVQRQACQKLWAEVEQLLR